MDNFIHHTNDVINTIRKKTDSVIIFYSCGKDSICLLDLIASHFSKIYVVFMYFVKGLDHIEKYLKFSEKAYSNIEIIQVPHWNLTYILREGVYCNADKHIKLMNISDIDTYVRNKVNCNYSIYGMKQSDSLNRRLMLKGYENEAISCTNKFYPLSKWNNAQVLKYIELKNLPSPICYSKNKKSQGMGFNLDVFLFLRENYPQDIIKILNKFPLSNEILLRHDYAVGNGGNKKD